MAGDTTGIIATGQCTCCCGCQKRPWPTGGTITIAFTGAYSIYNGTYAITYTTFGGGPGPDGGPAPDGCIASAYVAFPAEGMPLTVYVHCTGGHGQDCTVCTVFFFGFISEDPGEYATITSCSCTPIEFVGSVTYTIAGVMTFDLKPV